MSYRPTVSHEIKSAVNHNQITEMYFQRRKEADPADLALCFPPTVLIALKKKIKKKYSKNSRAASHHFSSVPLAV